MTHLSFSQEKNSWPNDYTFVTVLSVSGVLATLLIYYSRINNIHLGSSSLSWLLVHSFCDTYWTGFMILEITFIQKYCLLLGPDIGFDSHFVFHSCF